MSELFSVLEVGWVPALGITLIHFLWQGALVGAVVWILGRMLGTSSPQISYAVATLGMFALVMAPIATFPVVHTGMSSAPSERQFDNGVRPEDHLLSSPTASGSTRSPEVIASPEDASQQSTTLIGVETPPSSWFAPFMLVQFFVLLWGVGVLFLSSRLFLGWRYTVALRRGARSVATPELSERLNQIAELLGLRSIPAIRSTARVSVPTVVGVLRPMLVLPASLLSGMTPRQVDLILTHELAHIQRYDHVVNALQVVAETILFYHPVVWWVSGKMRTERERCCDDIVVATTGERRGYAVALARLESSRIPGSRLAVGASGGSLPDRIKRLLASPEGSSSSGTLWPAAGLIVAMVVVTLLAAPTMSRLWSSLLGAPAPYAASESRHERSSRTLPTAPPAPPAYLAPEIVTLPSRWFNSGYDTTARRLADLAASTRDPSTRDEALAELRNLRPRSARWAWMELVESSEDADVRAIAVDKLALTPSVFAYAVPLLEQAAIIDESATVRDQAMRVLLQQPTDLAIASAVRISRTRTNPEARRRAILWLGESGGDLARVHVERVLYTDQNEQVQLAALQALGNLMSKRRSFYATNVIDAIVETHPRESVRRAAVQMRESVFKSWQPGTQLQGVPRVRSGDYGTIRKLVDLLDRETDQALRIAVVDELAKLNDRSMPSELTKISRSDRDPAVRERAREKLAEVRLRDAAFDRNYEAAKMAVEAPTVKQRSRALEQVGIWEMPAAVSTLRDVAFTDPSQKLQLAAVELLAKREELQAAAILARVARTHPDATLRLAAVRNMRYLPPDDAIDVLSGVAVSDVDAKVRSTADALRKSISGSQR